MRAADCRNVSGVCCCGIIRITDDLRRGWCGHLELLGRYCGVDANYLTQVTLLPVVVRGWSVRDSMGGINSTGHGGFSSCLHKSGGIKAVSFASTRCC